MIELAGEIHPFFAPVGTPQVVGPTDPRRHVSAQRFAQQLGGGAPAPHFVHTTWASLAESTTFSKPGEADRSAKAERCHFDAKELSSGYQS